MPFPEPMHSQQPLAREGENIPYTSFVVSTSTAEPVVPFYDIEIQGDSDRDPVPTPKWEARKMTGNPFVTQNTKDQFHNENLALCHAISILQRDVTKSL